MFTGVTLKAKFARAETLLKDVSAKLEELTEKLPGIHFKPFLFTHCIEKQHSDLHACYMIVAIHVFTCTRL